METFVSFELAKKLKEKGFPQVKIGTLAMYNEEGEWYSLARNLDEFEYLFEDFDYHDCVCPTISQVLKWLREEKKIHISPVLWGLGWYVDIQSFTKETDEDCVSYDVDNKFQSIDYETYEEAVIAGVNYCLENLIR